MAHAHQHAPRRSRLSRYAEGQAGVRGPDGITEESLRLLASWGA
ncbi:hypothetical protein [Nonomuraea sp. NPDC050202]